VGRRVGRLSGNTKRETRPYFKLHWETLISSIALSPVMSTVLVQVELIEGIIGWEQIFTKQYEKNQTTKNQTKRFLNK